MLCKDFRRDKPKRDKHQRWYNDHVIKMANDGNKVWDQIEWHAQVADGKGEK